MNESALEKSVAGHQPTTTAVMVQMASHPIVSAVQIQTFVSADPAAGISTIVAVGTTVAGGTHQERPRIPSRSRSKTPPLQFAMKPAWSRYRSRSQTITQRQASGSIPFGFGQPAATGLRRSTHVSSMGLTDGMKSLTLNDCEDTMDYTWG
jgi:hypothetical protein